MIESLFKEFLTELELTQNQKEDAQTKYQNVCGCLDSYYYDTDYNEDHKYLFGSYKTKTNIRPLTSEQDVDVLFKIPSDVYEKYKDSPGGMLQDVRKALKSRFTTTDKISAWQKVVLVQFADGTHNVEILPALENDDKTFTIPDNANGGDWVIFDPRTHVEGFLASNKDTNGLTRELGRIVKRWVRETVTFQYKSYLVLEDVIAFLKDVYPQGKGNEQYDEIVLAFLKYMKNRLDGKDEKYSHFTTAAGRADKAVQYRKEGKHIEASDEWRKIFGSLFPRDTQNETRNRCTTTFQEAPKPWGW